MFAPMPLATLRLTTSPTSARPVPAVESAVASAISVRSSRIIPKTAIDPSAASVVRMPATFTAGRTARPTTTSSSPAANTVTPSNVYGRTMCLLLFRCADCAGLDDPRLVAEQRIDAPDGDAVEAQDLLAGDVDHLQGAVLHHGDHLPPQERSDRAIAVERGAARSQRLHALERLRHQVDQVGARGRGLGQRGDVDVRDPNAEPPVAHGEAKVPPVMRAIRLHAAAGAVDVFD